MKKLFAAFFLMTSTLTNAQLTEHTNYVEKNLTIGKFADARLTAIETNEQKIYTLSYIEPSTNANTNKFSFVETGNVLDELYTLLSSFFWKENKQNEN